MLGSSPKLLQGFPACIKRHPLSTPQGKCSLSPYPGKTSMSLQRAVKTPTRLVCSVIPVPPVPSFPPGEQMYSPTFHRTHSPSLVSDKSPGAPQPSSDILELNAPNNSCFPSAPPLLCITKATGNSMAGGVKHVQIYDFQLG